MGHGASHRTEDRVARWVMRGFGLMMLLCAAVTFMMFSDENKQADHRTATATATVVDVKIETSVDDDGNEEETRYPVLRFEDGDHVEHTGTSTIPDDKTGVGDSVDITYDPWAPEENLATASRDTQGERRVRFFLTLVMAVGFGIVGTLLMVGSFSVGRG